METWEKKDPQPGGHKGEIKTSSNMQKLQAFTLLFRSVKSFQERKMTPVRILDLCKGMNSWNAGECMPCLNVLRTEQNKTKPQIPTMHCGFVRHGELWYWQTTWGQWVQHREMCSCRFLYPGRRRTWLWEVRHMFRQDSITTTVQGYSWQTKKDGTGTKSPIGQAKRGQEWTESFCSYLKWICWFDVHVSLDMITKSC